MQHSPMRALRVVADDVTDSPRLRVAFATCRRKRDAIHPFGSAGAFLIYDVTATGSHLVKMIVFAPVLRGRTTANDNKESCEKRLDGRFEALAGCQLVFVGRIGVPATMTAIKRHVHVMEVVCGQSIQSALARCQAALASNTPTWMHKLSRACTSLADPALAALSQESADLGSAPREPRLDGLNAMTTECETRPINVSEYASCKGVLSDEST